LTNVTSVITVIIKTEFSNEIFYFVIYSKRSHTEWQQSTTTLLDKSIFISNSAFYRSKLGFQFIQTPLVLHRPPFVLHVHIGSTMQNALIHDSCPVP